MLPPRIFQPVTTTMEARAVCVSFSQLTGAMPKSARALLKTPKPGWYIHIHTRQTMENERMFGMNRSARKSDCSLLRTT